MKKSFIYLTLICSLFSSLIYAASHDQDNFTKTQAVTVTRESSFELDMTPKQALPLFTAPGEIIWVPNWEPVILFGDGFETGTVFTTRNHGSKTYWKVLNYDTETLNARYIRVNPEENMGIVDVKIRPNKSGQSTVLVTYQLTSLSVEGSKKLKESFSEINYEKMMKEWKAMIEENKEAIDQHFRTKPNYLSEAL